jgi:glutamate racemase
MIIVACNTASSIAINTLRKLFPIPILDVISPMEKLLSEHKSLQCIGVIGTHNTIQSKSYNKLLLSINPKLKILSQSCPLFVPIIEEGLENHPIAELMIYEYLSPLLAKDIDALILGCTHYPILKKTINKLISKEIEIIDSSVLLSSYTKQYLNQHKLININSNIATQLLVTDSSEHFNLFASKLLNNNFRSISTIQLF